MKKRTIRLFLAPVFIILMALGTAGVLNAALFQTDYPYGIQEPDDATLASKWTSWLGWFYPTNGAGGYHRVNYPEGLGCGGNTASEGIGYGLLLAVWYGDQTVFNELWN